MSKEKVILVTGAAGYWGSRVAARLVTQPDFHVIGLDAKQPQEKIEGLDFIQADIRNPLLAELLETEKVDTLCHLAFVESTRPNEAAFDANVMGTLKLFGACVEANVCKVVLKSSMAVYGAHPDNSAFLTEEHSLRGSRRYGYTRDMIEIEAFCNGFRYQSPQVSLTILRFPSIVGPTANTPMTRFLKEPRAPSLVGFDPMMQVVHEEDVVEALAYAVTNNVPGVFNVAAEGAMPLSKLMILARKIPLPIFHSFAYWGVGLLGGSGLRLSRYVPIELNYLRYTWVGDLTRMREVLGFSPCYTAEEALREFAGLQQLGRYVPGAANLAHDEQRLRDTLERRRQARQQPSEGELEARTLNEEEENDNE